MRQDLGTATLADGRKINFFPTPIGEGAMKVVYLSEDKRSVICFYKDVSLSTDSHRRKRLELILADYNPIKGSNGDYFQNIFCWQNAIVEKPSLGIITPVYPDNFVFGAGKFAGKEKQSDWFIKPKLRSMMPKTELGNWKNYLSIAILLARAIRRLHQAGLSHSDLSNRNVLIDPQTGRCLIIDIDSLVVPNLFPPDVLGTRGYIAPEVLKTLHLAFEDPAREYPSHLTDCHALAVLIYQYLLRRHPLEGAKTYNAATAEEQECLEMGEKALFIEHPTDDSNRPQDLRISYQCLGDRLVKLFNRAFIEGLHEPSKRPSALEWERELVKTWDLLHPCDNPNCPEGWFVLQDSQHGRCPFCDSAVQEPIPLLHLYQKTPSGSLIERSKVAIYHNAMLYQWHANDKITLKEGTDRTPQAYCVWHQGQWLLINQNLPQLYSPKGNRVATSPEPGKTPGAAIALEDGSQFLLHKGDNGILAKVEMFLNS